ncbi:3141_t:CDS:10 [Acaulospora colombiana]|uniref:3141_t:CDS:1 n=1 Tax=Acaulospora colombiana TaxID=27376 RepID=A0ACA9L0B0_9GLOM|nr:3141_t:CDS:10 [Acaulospora colombiana]
MVSSITAKIFGRNKFQPQGKGAHVTICARGQKELDATLEEIKAVSRNRSDYESLIFNAISADISKKDESIRALNEASERHNGKVPDVVICCAGFSIPRVFIEQPVEEFEATMQLNYFGTLYTTHEAVKRMAQQGVKGKIVFVSSVAAFVGFLGYSSYSPSKVALRSLAECLRHELILYDIGVHCYFPGTLDTEGLIEENKTKPKITKELEGEDKITPEQAAKALYKGLCKGNFFITSDIIGDAFRAASLGVSESNSAFVDAILCGILWTVSKPVRWFSDKMVRDRKSEHPVIPADNGMVNDE